MAPHRDIDRLPGDDDVQPAVRTAGVELPPSWLALVVGLAGALLFAGSVVG